MADLSVTYMGLKLKNPLVLGSSTITMEIDGVKKACDHGIGAVVLKSLFEEELKGKEAPYSELYHPEAYEYAYADASLIYGPSKYLEFIKKVKKNSTVPIIASVNCQATKWWTNYSEEIAEAGADGLELNISYLSFDKHDNPEDIEKRYIDIVMAIKNKIKIPVGVKIGYYFTSIPRIADKLKKAGADSLILFSRYFKMGINLDDFTFEAENVFSHEYEIYDVLRWVGIVHSQVDIDIAASTGVWTPSDAIKYIISGAKVVQAVSSVKKMGFEHIEKIIRGISEYMDKKGINNLEKLRGIANKDIEWTKSLERTQYMKFAGGNF